MRFLFSIIFVFIISQVKAQTFNPQLASMLQDSLNKYVALITNIKGMSASVYLPNQGMWKGTAGLSHAGQPITSGMQFGLASNTKLFVSTTLLKLAERNILDLDDPLSDFLPTYPNIDPQITIRQLLNHTSGISDPMFVVPYVDTIMNNPTKVFAPEEVLGWVGAPIFPRGTGWYYSNINYVLAGMVAESATGIHISKLIRDSILTPLDLDSTFYDVEEPVSGILAHRWFNGIDYHDTSRVGLNTAGGSVGAIFSTSGEMAQWYHALMSGQVLNPASFAELTTFVTTGTSYTYGLGFEKQAFFGRTTWGHGGSTWGYKSRMVYDPCSGAVVCGLANSWPAGMDGVTLILYKLLIDVFPGCPGSITGTNSICRGQNSVTYSIPAITNASSYVWTLPAGVTGTSTTNTITVNFSMSAISGAIKVKGINSLGESALAIFPVIVASVPIGVTQNGAMLTVDSIANTYQWLNCNNGFQPIVEQTGRTFTATANGSYAAKITKGSCTDTSNCVTVTTVGIATQKAEGYSLYPNPSAGPFTLVIDKASKIEIYNALGDLVYTAELNFGTHNLALEQPGGVYILKLEQKDSYSIRKLVIR